MSIWIPVVLSVALVALWVGTRFTPIFGILAIPAVAWLAVDYFNLNGWLVLWATLAAILAALFVVSQSARFAALAVVVALFTIGLGVHSWNEGAGARLAAAIQQQLNENNKQFAYEQSCAKPEFKPVCEKINGMQKQIDANTAAIKTLQGQVTTVTEKVSSQQVVIKSTGGEQDKSAATALGNMLSSVGWGPDDVQINNINEAAHVESAGNDRFSQRLRTKTRLVKYLNGATPAEVANRRLVLQDVPADQHARLLRGEGYYAVQFMRDVCLYGNAGYGPKGVFFAAMNCHKKGDILWFYVGSDGKVYLSATIRDDCGNAHLSKPPVPKPEKHVAPPRRTSTPAPPAPKTSAPRPPGQQSPPPSTHKPPPSRTTTPPPPPPTTSTPPPPPPTTSTPPPPPPTTSTPTCPHGGKWPVCSKASAPPPPGQQSPPPAPPEPPGPRP